MTHISGRREETSLSCLWFPSCLVMFPGNCTIFHIIFNTNTNSKKMAEAMVKITWYSSRKSNLISQRPNLKEEEELFGHWDFAGEGIHLVPQCDWISKRRKLGRGLYLQLISHLPQFNCTWVLFYDMFEKRYGGALLTMMTSTGGDVKSNIKLEKRLNNERTSCWLWKPRQMAHNQKICIA